MRGPAATGAQDSGTGTPDRPRPTAGRERRTADATFWQAAARAPLGVLATSWPWRGLLYLVTSLPLAVLWLSLCWPLLAVAGIPLGAVERRRLRLLERRPADTPHEPAGSGGPFGWARLRLREAATWLELSYGLLLTVFGLVEWVAAVVAAGIPLTLLAAPVLRAAGLVPAGDLAGLAGGRLLPGLGDAGSVLLGLLALPVAAYLVTVLAAGHARVARLLLTADRGEELDRRLGEVIRSRARIVDAFTAERRSIERNLHDGAQQRLTALVMRLGMALARFDDDPEAARTLVERAHREAQETLEELRDLVRGIHPAALTERGLAAAVEELADSCPVEVAVDADTVGRLPEPVESTAYFCVAELVANAVRHARADRVRLCLRVTGTRRRLLVITVTDDGVGGADPRRGTGLTGLADRVAVHGGTVVLHSPRGGPTTVEVRIPCVS
ncbi:sensor histidine kinase [Thermobifida alba]|uniref:sensor histidine kinase n=1 Tax=Thermobifida alba TaxID=53522 RepID=UPI0020BFDCEB|nr:sensor histidine kinase [Thermobifida alba]